MLSFRRRIDIVSRTTASGGAARAVLEDDFHHFRVALSYRDGSVTQADGWALRNPYTACPAASGQLAALVGMALDSVANCVTRATDARLQCTHMLDLAGLAIAAAARGIGNRRYDIEVPRRVDERTLGRLERDGLPLLEWRIDGDCITAPAAYAGINLREGMARWALTTLAEDEAEAALVLRRCVNISRGRERDLDLQPTARSSGNCYAQQPQRAAQAMRIVGSTLDFSERAAVLCADDREWLHCSEGQP